MGTRKRQASERVKAVGRQMKILRGPGLPVLLYFERGMGYVNSANEGNGMLIGEWSWTVYYTNLAF